MSAPRRGKVLFETGEGLTVTPMLEIVDLLPLSRDSLVYTFARFIFSFCFCYLINGFNLRRSILSFSPLYQTPPVDPQIPKMGELSREWIIVIVIISAAFSVLLLFAGTRLFIRRSEEGVKDLSNEQKDYQREVRMRNKGLNYFDARNDRHSSRHTDMTMDG